MLLFVAIGWLVRAQTAYNSLYLIVHNKGVFARRGDSVCYYFGRLTEGE